VPTPKQRQPVRLGKHGSDYMFEKAAGLHQDVMGLAVVTVDAHDPEVMFEEHGMGRVCAYFELQDDDVRLNEVLGPTFDDAERDRRATSDHDPTRIRATQGKFMLDSPARANAMLTTLREEVVPQGGGVFIVRTSKRLERRRR
jgi:hypothetical protein